MTAGRPGEMQAPDLVQPVIGYRLWRLGDDALYSPYVEERWHRGVHAAVVPRRAWRPRGGRPRARLLVRHPRLVRAVPDPELGGDAGTLVAGAIALWGDMELHPLACAPRAG
jgi:hypothetical protein